MEEIDNYKTQIRMNLWNVQRGDINLEHSKYCAEESCDKPIENIIPLLVGNKKFYLGVCTRHLAVAGAFDELLHKDDHNKVRDICVWESIRDKSGHPPELVGFPREDYPIGVKVWCKFCGMYHLHGGSGHKVAHCGGVTPYSKYGYFAKCVENSCPEYEGVHQWAITGIFPPQSECQNCKMLVDGHLKDNK